MKKIWVLGLVLGFIIFLLVGLIHSGFSKNSVKLFLFYAEEKGGLKVEEEVIKPLSEKYPIEVQSFNVGELKNYDLLTKFEKERKDQNNEIPVVIIGDKILGGEVEIRRNLETLVKTYAEKGGTSWPSLQPIGPEEGWIPNPPTEEEIKSGRLSMEPFSTCQDAFTVRR